jgi:hypothetical protein
VKKDQSFACYVPDWNNSGLGNLRFYKHIAEQTKNQYIPIDALANFTWFNYMQRNMGDEPRYGKNPPTGFFSDANGVAALWRCVAHVRSTMRSTIFVIPARNPNS